MNCATINELLIARKSMLKEKIKSLSELLEIRSKLKQENKKVVFTNGVFDILHRGHVEYLDKARTYGDVLILGLNTDSSAQIIKGEGKPLVNQEDRAIVLAGLWCVDFICFFEEETPLKIIEQLQPDVLIKGGDYELNDIVGKDLVEDMGGKVITIPSTPGFSTTKLIERVKRLIKERKLSA